MAVRGVRKATPKKETVTVVEGGVRFKVERVIPAKAAAYIKDVAASEKKSIDFLKRLGYLDKNGKVDDAFR